MDKIALADKFSQIHEYWQPHIGGELKDSWHHHDHEDEMFLVVKGRFRMEFLAGEGAHSTPSLHSVAQGRPRATQKTVVIDEGEFIVVPRGVEHKPVADEECWILLFEPASTLNTGNVVSERTVRDLERV